jgi:hypothetical protein
VGGFVGWRLLIAAQGCLPTCLCRVVHDHLVVGGVLGGDIAWLLERVPEEVALSALHGTRINWAMCFGCPSEAGNEPRAHCTILTMATTGPETRSLQEVMVPTSSREAPRRTFADLSPLELSGDSSPFDTSDHTLLAAW